ncbi:MAG: hypothetical protein OXE41_10535 [Gammaproteobacteria bacterium]|nr:hypothetical protein [Gammaproteobacteria bacterium]MCY4219128.1 hypothetical protein [Gammaproteobacteria bacterium]MCY4275811.1 hypothetical protein [Gammaproteobacteria bacterium]
MTIALNVANVGDTLLDGDIELFNPKVSEALGDAPALPRGCPVIPVCATRDYGFLEHMGMGVPRKIIQGMKEYNGTDPELLEENERFAVILQGG